MLCLWAVGPCMHFMHKWAEMPILSSLCVRALALQVLFGVFHVPEEGADYRQHSGSFWVDSFVYFG